MHQKNGEEKQQWMDSVQKNSSSVQEKQPYLRRSQETSKTNNIEGEWNQDRYNNPIGCSLSPVYNQYMFLEGGSQETFSAPRPTLSMNNYDQTSMRQTAKNSQRL